MTTLEAVFFAIGVMAYTYVGHNIYKAVAKDHHNWFELFLAAILSMIWPVLGAFALIYKLFTK